MITFAQVRVREAAHLERGLEVLDLACGAGEPALEIARQLA